MTSEVYRSRNRNANAGVGAGGNAVYGLGLIGAAVYFFTHADGFWDYVWALPKAILWPAFLVYELLALVYG